METGKVVRSGSQTALKRTVTVEVDPGSRLQQGDTVEIRKVLTDEQVGAKLREILRLGDGIDKRNLRDMANEVEENLGWPVLADLIRDVVGI